MNTTNSKPTKVTYTITNGCVKKPGCRNYVEEYIMPYAVAKPITPNRVTDK